MNSATVKIVGVGVRAGVGVPIAGLAAFAAVLAAAPREARADRRLTADGVAARVTATSFLVAARAADVAAAEAAVTEARVAWWPRLGARVRYARLSPITAPTLGNIVVTAEPGPVPANGLRSQPFAFAVLLDDFQAQASLVVPLSDYLLRTPHNGHAAGSARDATEAARASSTLQVGADGRLLFYAWARAQLQRQVAVQALEQAAAHLAEVSAAVAAQTATTADRLRVESQRAAAELLALRTGNLVVMLEDQLRTALHEPVGGEPFVVGENLDGDLPPLSGLSSLEEAWAEAMAHRPELAEVSAAEAAAAAQGRAVHAGVWPRLDAFGEALAGSPNPRYFPPSSTLRASWAVGVQVTWAPNDLAAASAAARGKQAEAAARRAQRSVVAEQIRAEVVRSFQAWREADTVRDTATRGLAAAEEATRVRRELFRAGRATSVELTDAETDLTRARLESVDARIDIRIARVRLLRAIGR